MSTERQGQVVYGTRTAAGQIDDGIEHFESYNERYDVLNLETPNFASGFFNTSQEITANDLLGAYNAHNALKTAAPAQYNAWRAALQKIRS
jgi:hypothetical protein